ncbi:hypothetical protein V8C44DRAFT_324577 [Trichoderma aethiopicum]
MNFCRVYLFAIVFMVFPRSSYTERHLYIPRHATVCSMKEPQEVKDSYSASGTLAATGSTRKTRQGRDGAKQSGPADALKFRY